MRPKNLGYIDTINNLDYYSCDEIGFSNKKYALTHKLYEYFGKRQSTYQQIFTKDLYFFKQIHQIWVFDDDKPIALGLAIHSDKVKILSYNDNELGNLLGNIQLYVKPEYRNKHIAANMITLLEKSFLKYENGFIIMQDDAYRLKHYITQFNVIDSNYQQNNSLQQFLQPKTKKSKYEI